MSPPKGPDVPRGVDRRRRILLVDRHPLVRRGLIALIEGEPDLEVCTDTDPPPAPLEAITIAVPDLVVVDPWLAGADGLDLVKRIRARHPELPILVFTLLDSPLYVERAIRAGAGGYVFKQEMGDAVLSAVHRLLGGERYLSPMARARLDRA